MIEKIKMMIIAKKIYDQAVKEFQEDDTDYENE